MERFRGRFFVWGGSVLVALVLAGCSGSESLDPTPTKLDGTESQEFEADDIEAAESASDAVKEYCDGAVSEAQRIGCMAHVEESDLP